MFNLILAYGHHMGHPELILSAHDLMNNRPILINYLLNGENSIFLTKLKYIERNSTAIASFVPRFLDILSSRKESGRVARREGERAFEAPNGDHPPTES